MRKPENTFVSGVHNHLPPESELHREKMHNPYHSGTWDWWYSGKKADLWVEYKYLPKLPARTSTLITPTLSELQKEWGDRRYKEGRNLRVIVGCPAGGVIYQDLEWLKSLTTDEFRRKLLTRKEIAQYLQSITL